MDSLTGAGLAAIGGMLFSQAPAFAQQYVRHVAPDDPGREALNAAGALEQPFSVLFHFNSAVLGATWTDYSPVLPDSWAALLYAIAGLVVGLMMYEGMKLPWELGRRSGHRRRRLFH
ncbi:DUF2937 family protein [Pararhodospirillum oryzae]|nr:DUF2937 family protein [Pararhodospirillum oryzae]